MKNFFEGHTSPPPRSAFAPPAPLCNEPGCFDRFANLLCVSLLQQWYTCLSVAMSVKISVFGGYFWRCGFVYILRKWIFIFTAFLLFLPCLILSCFTAFLFFFYSFIALFFYRWFVLFVPICFVISFLIPLLCYFVYGLNDSLLNVPRYHVATLPRCYITTLSSCHIILRSKIWRLTTLWSCFAVEDLPRCLCFVCRPAVP